MAKTKGRVLLSSAWAVGAALVAATADAKPTAPAELCKTYPGLPSCLGTSPDCQTCHVSTSPPVKLGAFGADVKAALEAYIAYPFDNQAFVEHLSFALTDIETRDSDGDGFANLEELLAGTLPGDPASQPKEAECPTDISGLDYSICRYDRSFTFRKVAIDFCGLPPTFEETEDFLALSANDQDGAIHAKLDACLDSQFWIGFNGVVWSLAHEKIRPLGAFFNPGQTNFFFDYALFTWTQIDGHDVRDMLVADYLVNVLTPNGEGDVSVLQYQQANDLPGQPMQPDRRAGLLTLAWPLFYNTMFTALPRTTAAQAYRAFLGLDIAKSEGLDWGVPNEPVDYDEAGVGAEACAQCHSTLNPLAYPFATYNGIQADAAIGLFMYDPDRIQKYFVDQFPLMANMPEAGYIFGQPVQNLLEWAQVAANSDPFYVARAKDYWVLLLGEQPRPEDARSFAEFTALWENLRDSHSIEAMLHQLIDTEAYGAP